MTESTLKLVCIKCGSSLAYSATDQNLKCQYCGTIAEIPKLEEDSPLGASSIYPLSVEISALTDAVHDHLASGDLTPDNLLEHATISKTERFYVPAIEFFGNYEAQWTASFGYDRQEHYTEYETQTVNGHSRQVAVTKTKTVTDWRPVNGTDTGKFYVTGYAGNRLSNATVDATPLVEIQTANSSVPFDKSYVTGFVQEDFCASEDEVYQSRAKSQVNSIIDRNVRNHGQGDHQKDWHWTANISKSSETVLVPICQAVYEYEGKEYNVWVRGDNASRLIADPLPIDQDRKIAIQKSFAPVVAATVTSLLCIWKLDANWILPMSTIAVAGGLGYWRKTSIINFSLKLRQSILASKRNTSANSTDMTVAEQRELLDSIKHPVKPWIAKTESDSWLVPIASIVLAAVPFVSTLDPGQLEIGINSFFNSSNDSRISTNSHNQLPIAASQQTGNSGTTSEFPRCAGSLEMEKCIQGERALANETSDQKLARQQHLEGERNRSQSETSTQVESNAQQQSTPSLSQSQSQQPPQNDSRVDDLKKALEFSLKNNWGGVDSAVNSIKSQVQVIPQGNRKLSRAANNEGLAYLKSNDVSAAVEAFARGTQADPADIEVKNNLGYALLKAQRDKDSAGVLVSLLIQVPERTSAWTNLSEAMVSTNINASLAALKIGVRFSANRDKTVVFLTSVVETHPNERFRSVVKNVLDNLDSIPSGPLR